MGTVWRGRRSDPLAHVQTCLSVLRTNHEAPEIDSPRGGEQSLRPYLESFDTRLNATGTLGGEGSLMAMKASSVGVAVNLGTGSIGITAGSSGTYGLRTTCG